MTSHSGHAQQGAWRAEREGNTHVLIVAIGHFSEAIYADKKFVATRGGKWETVNNQWVVTEEFNTLDTKQIGSTQRLAYLLKGEKLTLGETVYARIDDGTPGVLAGAWLITGRMVEGVMHPITPGVRKTMKILSGTRFQWIAYNSETKEFFGTGGGTYTSQKGVYTETIEFFSRDSTRVGAKLDFQFSLPEGNWRHTGKSSKGEPIDEQWTERAKLGL